MLSKVIKEYVDPLTKVPLYCEQNGDLYEAETPHHIAYENRDGTYDFVVNRDESDERQYYDNLYSKDKQRIWSIEDFKRAWHEEPGFEQLLRSMGDISEKKILLLGNGISLKELYFLQLRARCVYTDLSVDAVKYVKAIFEQSELKRCGFDQIEFHAVDACHLPFQNESFDIIYGCAFIHHIENLDRLFSEIKRCLKPGGKCRFMDHAYSPLWQLLKNTLLKPVQLYAHKKHGISPADLVATKRGGYTREELERLKKTCGFSEMLCWRVAFFEHLLQRGTLKLGGQCLRKLKPFMRALDVFGDKVASLIQRHGIVLVWGFTK